MGILSNGEKSQTELREDQVKDQEHLQNLSGGRGDEQPEPDFVRQMMDSELEDATLSRLSNLLSRDWVLSQMNDAEVHEARWLARTMSDEIIDLHPPDDSVWTGAMREYAADDDQQHLEPLTSTQKAQIFQFIQGYISRVLRSREGMQQEMFRKTISKSEREDRSEDNDGGWI